MNQRIVLVLRALGLGDFLTGLPALQLVRCALPEHRLVLAAPMALAPLVDLVPDIDELFGRGELQPLTGFGHEVDVGIDLHGKGFRSRNLLAALHPRAVLGFADREAGLPGPVWRRDEHEVTRWCRMVDEAFGLQLPVGRWPTVSTCLSRPDVSAGTAREDVTVVHPGAAAGSRRWPADRFIDVAGRLVADGHRVVITGGGSETPLARRIAAGSGAEPLTGMDLAELAAVIASARVVVCGDTGVGHLASAYGTPSVLLFGPISPVLWGPPALRRHVVLWHGDGTGDPHGSEPDPALLRITVDEVLDAVAQLDRLAASGLPARHR